MAPRDLVSVGLITGAHGVRGEVKLRSFTADPAALPSYNPLQTAKGAKIEIVRLRPEKDGFIATLKGVADRNAAELLRNTELFVARSRLPEPSDDEVYVADLMGCTVLLADGQALGEVVDFPNYGAGDLLEVKRPDRAATVLVPFTDAFVTAVSLATRTITVDLPDDYLDEAASALDA